MSEHDFESKLAELVNLAASATLDPYKVRDLLRARADKIDQALAIAEALGGRRIA